MQTKFLYSFIFFSALLFTQFTQAQSSRYVLFGRGTYPGDDSTVQLIQSSGFNTLMLSSFYIRSNGDVYSGDDNKHPVISRGKYVGDREWVRRIAAIKRSGSVKRIEILLEGRWYNQTPNTYDFIRDWIDSGKGTAGVITGTAKGSTLYNVAEVFKHMLGADALCIDDESVYDSNSIIQFGKMLHGLGMQMTLCPYTKIPFWKKIMTESPRGLIDAVYLQCYDGGARNTPAPWISELGTQVPLYPVFLCRGSFGNCSADHNSKTPSEIATEMERFKKEYPQMDGAGIWQLADIKEYIRLGCAAKDASSGNSRTVAAYIQALRQSIE